MWWVFPHGQGWLPCTVLFSRPWKEIKFAWLVTSYHLGMRKSFLLLWHHSIPKHHLISNCDTTPPGSLDFRWAVVCLPGGHKGGSGGLGGEEGGLDNNYTIVTFHSELGKITAFLPAVLTQRWNGKAANWGQCISFYSAQFWWISQWRGG